MPRCCVVKKCLNSKKRNVILHRFPTNPKQRLVWVHNVIYSKSKPSLWQPSDNSRICSDHFEEYNYESQREDGLKKLKYFAVPTIFHSKGFDPAGLRDSWIEGDNFNAEKDRDMSNVSDFQKGQIVGAWLSGASVTGIATLLNVPQDTVSKVMSVYEGDEKAHSRRANSLQNKRLNGDRKPAKRNVGKGRKASAAKVTAELDQSPSMDDKDTDMESTVPPGISPCKVKQEGGDSLHPAELCETVFTMDGIQTNGVDHPNNMLEQAGESSRVAIKEEPIENCEGSTSKGKRKTSDMDSSQLSDLLLTEDSHIDIKQEVLDEDEDEELMINRCIAPFIMSSYVKKEELRILLLYEFKLGHDPTEAATNINRAWGEETTSEEMAVRWFQKFRGGKTSLEDLEDLED